MFFIALTKKKIQKSLIYSYLNKKFIRLNSLSKFIMPENVKNKGDVQPIKFLKGVYRRTLVFDDNLMMCHFILSKNAEIPLHNHKENQIGYIIKGKLKFMTEHRNFICKEGDSYIFESNEKHGAVILEDSEVIDVFNPAREDYK